MEEKYYIRSQGYVGNSFVWWRPNGAGYTSDLNNAGKYSKEDAKSICSRSTENDAFPCDDIDKCKAIIRCVDSQYFDLKPSF